MIESIPSKPVGNTPLARWLQAAHEKLWGGQSRINDGPNTLINRTTRGVSIIPKGGKVSATTSVEIIHGVLLSQSGDFLKITRTTSAGIRTDTIAKPYDLRASSYQNPNTRARTDGTHEYTNTGPQTRTDKILAAPGGFPEGLTYSEMTWPEYVDNETVIFGISCDDTGVFEDPDTKALPVKYLAMNDGRSWAYKDSICVNGVQKLIWTVGSPPYGTATSQYPPT